MKIKINRELNAEQLRSLCDFVNNEETTNRQHWNEVYAEGKDKKTLYISYYYDYPSGSIWLKCRFDYANKDGRIVSITTE